jgi:hypothetical protein
MSVDNIKQTIRYFLFILNLYVLYNQARFYETILLFSYFTNWGIELTIVSLYLTIKCAKSLNYDKRPYLIVIHHLLFELAFLCELIVTAIYWIFLY